MTPPLEIDVPTLIEILTGRAMDNQGTALDWLVAAINERALYGIITYPTWHALSDAQRLFMGVMDMNLARRVIGFTDGDALTRPQIEAVRCGGRSDLMAACEVALSTPPDQCRKERHKIAAAWNTDRYIDLSLRDPDIEASVRAALDRGAAGVDELYADTAVSTPGFNGHARWSLIFMACHALAVDGVLTTSTSESSRKFPVFRSRKP